MNMRASGTSELRKFSNFYILKLLFLQYFVGTSYTLFQKHIYFQVSNNICILTYTINAVSFSHLTYDAIYKQQYTDKTLTLRKCMYMRASGASELRKLSQFHILKLLFPPIFCWYNKYYTSDTLSQKRIHGTTSAYTINAVSFYYLWYGAIYKRQYTDKR